MSKESVRKLTAEQREIADKYYYLILEYGSKRNIDSEIIYDALIDGYLLAVRSWRPDRGIDIVNWLKAGLYRSIYLKKVEITHKSEREGVKFGIGVGIGLDEVGDVIDTIDSIVSNADKLMYMELYCLLLYI